MKNYLHLGPLTRWQVFLLYAILAIILRFFSFFPSVIDHDESTYLEIARMLLAGKILYIDMVDIKPPGIFIILAGFQAIFGDSIFIIRLLVAIWIGITSFLIYETGKLLWKNEKASLASGVIYIFFISTWSFYGISISPEIFFNLFTISAFYLLLRKQNPLYYLLAGLIAGLGFLVKYLVLADFTVLILFMIIFSIHKDHNQPYASLLFSVILSGAGFILPFALVNLVYYTQGHFDQFYNIIYLAPERYVSAFELWKMIKYLLTFQLLFFPVFFFFYYALIDKHRFGQGLKIMKLFCMIWILIDLAAVIVAGRTFGHYTIQLMLPASLTAGLFFHSERRLDAPIYRFFNGNYVRYILYLMIIVIMMLKLEYVLRRDIPREIASYLEPKLRETDVIYTGNYHHILYFLLKKDSPTKYIHRSLLLSQKHIKALDIDVDEEFRKIIAHQPLYIITEKQFPNEILRDVIINKYFVEKDFGEDILLYKRLD